MRQRDRTMLLLEDPGGEPLERQLGEPMEVPRFLQLAINIAAALRQVHQRGLVHKDLKPGHILVDGGNVYLTGFGLASRLPRERQSPSPPEFIVGTLAYMAPEQTGRMNRSIDSRSDLYSLGVTFYQMLTGVLPFLASHPMEWIHCHVARTPVPPHQRVAGLSHPISHAVRRCGPLPSRNSFMRRPVVSILREPIPVHARRRRPVGVYATAGEWRWDLARIRAKGYTENVVDLMVDSLSHLPPETQTALKQLACLGNAATTAMLSTVLGASEDHLHATLWEAVRHDLVERLDGSYRFVHDRVQEATYSSIPGDQRARAHLLIGRLIAAQTPPEKPDELIFEIVNQLNRCLGLITAVAERQQSRRST